MLDLIRIENKFRATKYTIDLTSEGLVKRTLETRILNKNNVLAALVSMGIDKNDAIIGIEELLNKNKHKANFGTQGLFIYSK
jgi:hypothetical protein